MSNHQPNSPHKELANSIRALAMDAVQKANSGHPGMPMGMADVATVLFTQFLKFDPTSPKWPDRDRFVLSAGHGSMLLYALLYLTGYKDLTIEEIKNFRQLGSKTAGHPEYGHAKGIETTTGPLGQGFANAVGMALAERILAARFGEDLVDHHTYVIASDGDLMEGISHEAGSFAGHLGLSRLIVFFDDNSISIDGSISLSCSDDVPKRFNSYGWCTIAVDGHNPVEIASAIATAQAQDKPTLISCKTTIGYGAPTKSGTAASHGAPLGADEIKGVRESIGWPHVAFEIPDNVLSLWRKAGQEGAKLRTDWEGRLKSLDKTQYEEFDSAISGELPTEWKIPLINLKKSFAKEEPSQATRVSSGMVLQKLTDVIPNLMGGSADLTGSVNTLTQTMSAIKRGNFAAQYLHYGIREHGMAAAMIGMALHGGIIPYAGTFLIFADYLRPSLRLAALMGQRVIFVLTHDSIGLGEDGPTHQPIEHLASLRGIPNLNVFRPADSIEVAECWELALESKRKPSVISLTRQSLPTLRTKVSEENKCAKGAYVISPASSKARVVILGTGSEVSIATKAQKILEAEGITTSVVSMPCWEFFDKQPDDYQVSVLGKNNVKIAVEAAISQGWERYTGDNGGFVGMSSFGASAPAGDLFNHFGITAQSIVEAAKARL